MNDKQEKRKYPRQTQIDKEHNSIRYLITDLYDIFANKADFFSIEKAYYLMEGMIQQHFNTEENELNQLKWDSKIGAHIKGHKASHDVIRLAFEYTRDQFDKKRDAQIIPNIVELLPKKYFEELEGWDIEMMHLLDEHKKYQGD